VAEITDPQVVKFSNDYLRPLAEILRNLDLFIGDAAIEYTTIIAPLLAPYQNTDVLNDGRASEGVTPVTKLELADMITHLDAVRTVLETVGADELRAKFTVRPPKL
jgi:hypothetical protein